MMIRVLHLLNTSAYSGAENVVISIITNTKQKCTSAYASLDGSIRTYLEKNEIEFLPLKRVTIREIKRAFQKFHPDIIHAHDFRTSVLAALAKLEAPIISHLHNNPPWIRTFHPYSIAYLLSSSRYFKILGVSSSIFTEYIFGKNLMDKAIVMSNPIDGSRIVRKARECATYKNNSYHAVFIGRLAPQKNPMRFIKIMSMIIDKEPTFKVAVIGDGHLYKDCLSLVNSLNVSKNIHFLGFVENPYCILSQASVLCMTSDYEGFGLVAVEALALGIPVVAFPVGGIPSIINSTCGFLADNDSEFADEVLRLFKDKDYFQRKSGGALQRICEIENVNSYMDHLLNIYEQAYWSMKRKD